MTDTAARQRQLIGSSAAWVANNLVLGSGEIGIEVVTASDVRMKVGDGTTTFSVLPFASASGTTINSATQTALDAKVALAGGTMTGLLVLSGNPSAALGATTKQYVDAINSSLTTSISAKLPTAGGTMTGALTLSGAPSSSLHATTKTYVDTANALNVVKSGDTMSGFLTLSADPTSALHAATMNYVDTGAYQTTVGGSSTYAGKVVKLNAAGVLDSSMLTTSATYLGTVNLTVTYALSGSYTAGNYYAVSLTGTIDASWSTHLNGSPSTCSAGQSIIYNSGTSKWDLVGDTTSSTAITGKLDKAGGTMTGALVLSGAPTIGLHAATKTYADTMVPLVGGTMSGLLTLSANPSAALGATTKQYVDAADATVTAAYIAADTALNGTITTSLAGKLALAGGTMTGALVLSGAPTIGLHAATKTYTDAADALATLRANNLSDVANTTTARANLGLGSIATLSSIAYLNIQNVSATARILGRKTASAGVTEEVNLSELLDFIGSAAQGDILYRGATTWARLPAGSSGQYLQSNGSGANPAWANVSAGATLLQTLTTTSGTSPSATGLSLTSYKRLYVVLSGVSSSTVAFGNAVISMAGVAITTSQSGSNSYYGGIQIDLMNGFSPCGIISNTSNQLIVNTAATYFAITTATTSITFSTTGTGFDAGSVLIYGLA